MKNLKVLMFLLTSLLKKRKNLLALITRRMKKVNRLKPRLPNILLKYQKLMLLISLPILPKNKTKDLKKNKNSNKLIIFLLRVTYNQIKKI